MNAKLKKFQKIYEIARAETEVRVNDYNPVLLKVWGGNMDIQFTGEKDTHTAVATAVSMR